MADKRGRPKLPIGSYGEIAVWPAAHSTKAKPVYVAKARFRDSDGVTRSVTKSGSTKGRARSALLKALASRQKRVVETVIGSDMTVSALAEQWLEQGTWSVNTDARYRLAAGQVTAELGQVRLKELTRSAVNSALTAIKDRNGAGSAKSAKSVLSGMVKLALLYDALDQNPIRDSISVSAGRPDNPPDALTPEQVDDLCDKLRSDTDAVERFDVADLVEFMLATGARIGEVCAARHASLNLDVGTWEINATAVRVPKVGMTIQPRPKTAAGWRVLALPSYAVELLRRRSTELSMSTGQPVIFGSPYAKAIRDPSNTAGDLRQVLDRLGYDWVSSHTFRRTVATRLDEAGLSARQVADQLGHAKPSMTQDKYMGRNVVSADAARILDR